MVWLQSLNLDYAFWLTISAIFILLLMSAFFSGSETALTAASRGKLQTQADKGSRGAATVSYTHLTLPTKA